MRVFDRRDNGVTIYSDEPSDNDMLVIMGVLKSFSPARGALFCGCGAAVERHGLRCMTSDGSELSCHVCHRVLGHLQVGVQVYR
jgi:hypothetical protein